VSRTSVAGPAVLLWPCRCLSSAVAALAVSLSPWSQRRLRRRASQFCSLSRSVLRRPAVVGWCPAGCRRGIWRCFVSLCDGKPRSVSLAELARAAGRWLLLSPLCCVSLSPLASVRLARLLSVGCMCWRLLGLSCELGVVGAAGRSSVGAGLLMPCRLSARAFALALRALLCRRAVGLAYGARSLARTPCGWPGPVSPPAWPLATLCCRRRLPSRALLLSPWCLVANLTLAATARTCALRLAGLWARSARLLGTAAKVGVCWA